MLVVNKVVNFFKKYWVKVLHIAILYSIFATVALTFCCFFPSESPSDNVAFFVGVAGTLASLFSIIISAIDTTRAEEESLENKAFINKLSSNVDFLKSSTIDVKSDVHILLEGRFGHDGSAPPGEEHNEDKKSDVWENPEDEIPPM